MAVDIAIGGASVTGEVARYSITEEAQSLDVTDLTGGVGQMSVELRDRRAVRHSRFREVSLTDSDQGETVGRVSSITTNSFLATITADSRMISLVAVRSAQPYSGTLSGLFTYYLSLAGITTGIVIDSSLASIPITVAGWNGSVYDAIKRLCAAHRVEASLVSNNIVLRPVRQRVAQNHRDAEWSMSIDDSQLAQSIIVNYMHSAERRADLAYPVGGWVEDTQVFNVNAGETLEFEVDLRPKSGEEGLGASLSSVIQPVCIDFVGRDVTDSSVYCVAGNDGKPITAAQWTDDGGKLSVRIGEDTQTLIITVTGARTEKFAPYRIAATAGTGNFYSSLRVRGTGVFYDQRKLTMSTGNDADVAPTQIGAEVQSEMLVGYERAWNAAADALASWTGPTLALSVTTRGINRTDDTGSAAYPTIDNFNAMYPNETFSQFNALWGNQTVDDLNSRLFALVENAFENQAFGNIAGARVESETAWFRIRSATIEPSRVSYQAQNDTTISDWNAHYGSTLTFDQFNDLIGNEWSTSDMGVEPLLDSTIFPPPPIPIYPDGHYPDTFYPSRSDSA